MYKVIQHGIPRSFVFGYRYGKQLTEESAYQYAKELSCCGRHCDVYNDGKFIARVLDGVVLFKVEANLTSISQSVKNMRNYIRNPEIVSIKISDENGRLVYRSYDNRGRLVNYTLSDVELNNLLDLIGLCADILNGDLIHSIWCRNLRSEVSSFWYSIEDNGEFSIYIF